MALGDKIYPRPSEAKPSESKRTPYGLVESRDLVAEMEESYIDYAMSVIISRALPDVRDGLKPVHRRILYAMWESGLRSTHRFAKSAKVVGEVMGKYHPHGDVAIYDSLVRLAQPWNMGSVLIESQGNFGSVDGDAAAAMRYTECRLHRLADELLADIEKETVDFTANFDNSFDEPKVLPTRLPNLLINGAQGIAVGMATNIPPHNLGEVIEGLIYLIDHPQGEIDELMKLIKGPDFPTGANVYNRDDIKQAYATGKGRIMMRAAAEIIERGDGYQIIISELPYQVNKAALISKIAELVRDKRLEGITDIRDESDRHANIRIVIDLKSHAFPQKVLNRLYDLTPMQSAFHVNMLALAGGLQPRVLTLKHVLDEFIRHRQAVVRRRSVFELNRAKERLHIVEGLLQALREIEAVIATIRRSRDRAEAHRRLIEAFRLTAAQANAILDMRLAQLAALERERVEEEASRLKAEISALESLLASEEKIFEVIKDELTEIKERFHAERRTKIHPNPIGQFSALDLIPDEEVAVVITEGNYIKRLPVETYRSQHRGGHGVVGMATKEEDKIQHLLTASTHDEIFFFTQGGRVFLTKVYEIPSASRQAKGTPLVNVIQIGNGERVTAMMTTSARDAEKTKKAFILATTGGMIKRSLIASYKNVRKTGIVAMRLGPGDDLKWVHQTSGHDTVFQATAHGQAISYSEEEIRIVGRSAGGVRGIRLRDDDQVITMDVVPAGLTKSPDLLIVLENGFGKRTGFDNFRTQHRGGLGLKCANVTGRTGSVVGVEVVLDETGDALLISRGGVVIRTPVKAIRRISRATQGVTLMRLGRGDTVASLALLTSRTV